VPVRVILTLKDEAEGIRFKARWVWLGNKQIKQDRIDELWKNYSPVWRATSLRCFLKLWLQNGLDLSGIDIW
jgi:hypothetical protein